MRERLERVAPWLTGAALVGLVPGFLWAPDATWALLVGYAIVMLVRIAGAAAREIGARATVSRTVIGASAGPWLVLADRDLATSAALEVSAVAALLMIALAYYTRHWRVRIEHDVSVAHRGGSAP